MKFIKEWQQFLAEANFISDYNFNLDYDEDGDIILYHISPTPDIETFDPDIAAGSAQNYTTREYITWNRPRVFFFTKLGQEDTGIGKIPGENYYKIKISPEKLYPVTKDPAQLSSPQEKEKYMVDNVPEYEVKYKQAEKCDSVLTDYPRWHICAKTPNSDGLAWEKVRGVPSLLLDDPKFHRQKPNTYELVAQLAEERYGTIGFIYPQDKGDDDTLIAVIWRPIETQKLDNYYSEET